VDDTGKGTYTFALPDGYGAYVEATFNPAPEPETTIVVDVDASEAGNEGKTENNVKVVMTQSEGQEPTTEQRTVVNKETGKEETIEATVIPVAIEGVNIPANVESENISVTVPSEVVSGNVVYRVTEIKADAFKTPEGSNAKVTKVILPETESALVIAEGAMKPDGRLVDIETSLALLDDYALMKTLKENFEALKISAHVTAPNKYWSFSSGVDCVLPDGVTAYIAEWNGMPRIIALEGDQLLLADGRRGIKANNGVLIAGTKGNVYEIVASSGNQQSGSTPVTTDAKSFEGNCLVPTIVATNYDAEKYLVLKDNTFHTIKSNSSKVKPCKAVFSLEKAGVK
jgi:hypothetical protein